jgi:hypothetical protein
MEKHNVLAFALEQSATRMRGEESKCRRQLVAFGDATTPLAIVTATLADLHAKAAHVYEDALAVLLEGGAL